MRADFLAPSIPRSRRSTRSVEARLIALDSDGTVLDSMTPKHVGAFAPAFSRHFGSSCPKVASEVWVFVNLESRSRGTNRYRALVQCLRLLPSHPAVPRIDPDWANVALVLEAWLATEPAPCKASLELAASAKPGPLRKVLAWTREVDRLVAELPKPRPFEGALAALPEIGAAGEILVLSAAPREAIRTEWTAAGILDFAIDIDGQERGPKAACLASRCVSRSGQVLVVGDAPGDLEAARSAGAAFFPVISGREEECWRIFRETGLARFLEGERSPGRGLLADFLASLPSDPPWLTRETLATGRSLSRTA